VELARVLHRTGSPNVGGALLTRLESNPRETRTIRLSRPVRINLVYELAEVRDGQLVLHPDVYGRAGPALVREQAIQALLAAGRAADSVDGTRLDELVRESRRSRVAVPLDAVVSR
jgi:hypothetical protein